MMPLPLSSSCLHKILIFLFMILLPLANSISFNYNSFYPNIGGISLEGDAFSSSGVLHLTKNGKDDNLTYSVGRATYILPVHIWDGKTGNLTDFTSHFSFEVKSIDPTNYGDGLSFFLAPVGSEIPANSSGGLLGLFSPNSSTGSTENHIVAVEFDSYPNSWDPPYNHIGININSIEAVAYCTWVDIFPTGTVVNAWVSYDSTSRTLSVFANSEGENFSLSHLVDLREVLPEWATIGISAATGASIELHGILSWEFYSSLEN
ncbi:lectin 7-like [Hevea brasiliensis]|nr:lectin 7-like [Hevea brasiliensis]